MSITYNHVQLSFVDSSGNVKVFYPKNTGSDVYIDRNSNSNIPSSVNNVQLLANNMSKVSFSNNYSDLSGLPTLGTAASKNYTTSITSGSSDLITSGAVNSLKETLVQQINYNGAKNLVISNKYGTYTNSSGTYIRNADDSWKVTGSGNNVLFYLSDNDHKITLKANQKYTFSGGYNDNLFLELRTNTGATWYKDAAGNMIVAKGTETTFTNGSVDAEVIVAIRLQNNVAVDNFVYPMLRLASNTDTTFEPYTKTNQQLTKETTGLINNLNNNGCKNLFNFDETKYNYSGSSLVFSYGDNCLNIITGGTSGAEFTYPSATTYTKVSENLKPNTEYILSYGKTVISGLALQVYYKATSSSDWTRVVSDVSGVTHHRFTTPSSFYTIWVRFCVYSSGSVGTGTIYPMLCLASDYDLDPTFVPYAKSNKELTEEVDSIRKHFYENAFSWSNGGTKTFPSIDMSSSKVHLLVGGRLGKGFVILLYPSSGEYSIVYNEGSIISSITWTISSNVGTLSITWGNVYGSSCTYSILW